jgi:methylated-DNA-[protein]-cysteine S-methyltransferase
MTNDELCDRLRAAIMAPDDWATARLAANLAARATRQGLLDVAYTSLDCPLGTLIVCATPRGVVRIAFDNEPEEQVLLQLAAHVSPRILSAPALLDNVRSELDEYFAGLRTAFDLPLDWTLTSGFRRKVLAATDQIPYGRTGTYHSIATAAGSRNAFRAAGTALATNPIPIIIPCHRVVLASGAIGQYRGGSERKQRLLDLEARTWAAQLNANFGLR